MNEYTKGKWTAHDDDGTGTLPCILSDGVNAGGNFYVAQCNNYADAVLIATAPKLLEACKIALSALDNCALYTREGQICAMPGASWEQKELVDAIAAAEGKEG